MLTLNAEERAIRHASDHQIEQWHERAKEGNEEDREKLCCWVYLTAFEYYHSKVGVERHFTLHDAEELTSQFFVEFEQMLPRIRSATHFTRRMLGQMLGRYIQRERKHYYREGTHTTLDEVSISRYVDEHCDLAWERWSDSVWYQYQATQHELHRTDAITRKIIEDRVRDVAYSVIAVEIRLSEAALRMRVARFYDAVRRRYRRRFK